MKQQILNLKKKLLLVELPEDCDSPIMVRENVLRCWNNKKWHSEYLTFEGQHKLIGKLADITESQFAEWVETWTGLMDVEGNYKDYKDSIFRFNTAKESFFSYLAKEGILFSNPLGDRPNLDNISVKHDLRTDYLNSQEKWQEAESKVWVLSNCYLFEILN